MAIPDDDKQAWIEPPVEDDGHCNEWWAYDPRQVKQKEGSFCYKEKAK